MTEKEINDLLEEAKKITPEQKEFLEGSDSGKNIGSILKPSQMFNTGLKTALGNVRRILSEKG